MKTSLLARTSVILLAALVAAMGLGSLHMTAARATTPDTPSVNLPGVVVFSEDFEHGSVNSAFGAQQYSASGSTQYVGATGQTYTGSASWIDAARCNGVILSYANTQTPSWAQSGTVESGTNNRCAEIPGIRSYQFMRMLALAMGRQFSSSSPNTNHVSSSYTECPSTNSGGSPCDVIPSGPTDGVMFKTKTPISVTPEHYYSFGVDTASMNCGTPSGDPSYQFATVDTAGIATPIGDPINACQTVDNTNVESFQQQVTSHVGGIHGNVTRIVNVNSTTSSSAIRATGNTLGLAMWNNNGTTNGNDGAFDNVRLLDVTPQLDQAFVPALVGPGGKSTLNLTISNTKELNAKTDWSISQVLPAGLVVAAAPNVAGTCVQEPGTAPLATSAAAGSGVISISGGDLASGQRSCTLSVDVSAVVEGSYSSADASLVTNLNHGTDANLLVRAPRIALSTAFASARATDSDQLTVGIRTGAADGPVVSSTTTATTAGSKATITAGTGMTGKYVADAGTTYHLTEWGGIPSSYQRTITCTDASGLQPDLPDGAEVGESFALVPVAGADITCIMTSTAVPLPGLVFTNTADALAIQAPARVGDVIHFSFRATNTGNVTLTDVAVQNALKGLPALAYTWPGPPGQLLPGQSMTATAAYGITQDDIDAGRVLNSAWLSGAPATGPTMASLPVGSETPLPSGARLEFSNTADASAVGDPARANDVVTYKFTARNVGNVALRDVAINDPLSGLRKLAYKWPGTPGELQPGETVLATATYKLTGWDIGAGKVANAATAHGTPLRGSQITTPPATATVTLPGEDRGRANGVFQAAPAQSPGESLPMMIRKQSQESEDRDDQSDGTSTITDGTLAYTGAAFALAPAAGLVGVGTILFLIGRRKPAKDH
ncbi:hypothetical protein ACIQC5_23860 [Paenarthrobacter sp. NPDC092416]|uniref:DUF7507 domain-containing protein n=1 Tax=Paenarthrobacter sp. NPDC092416 TaxID=3364386 RepID=UPI00382AB962